MAGAMIGAIMVIVTTTTSGSPSSSPDETRIYLHPYDAISECVANLKSNPLSGSEIDTEMKYKVRTMRACMEPSSGLYYNWTLGKITAAPDETKVETGPFFPR